MLYDTGLDQRWTIRLSGNSLTGCIPVALEDVATSETTVSET